MNWTDSGVENFRAISSASLITTARGVAGYPRNSATAPRSTFRSTVATLREVPSRREFGVLRFLGLRRRDVLRLLALEGAAAGTLGAAIGLVAGIAMSGVATSGAGAAARSALPPPLPPWAKQLRDRWRDADDRS